MDWMALISMLFTTILPLIISKGPSSAKFTLQRMAARYERLSNAATDTTEAFALGTASDICLCLAESKTKGDAEQLLAASRDGFGAFKSELAAARMSQATAA